MVFVDTITNRVTYYHRIPDDYCVMYATLNSSNKTMFITNDRYSYRLEHCVTVHIIDSASTVCVYMQIVYHDRFGYCVHSCNGQKVFRFSTFLKHTFCSNFKQVVGPGVLQTFSTCAVKP